MLYLIIFHAKFTNFRFFSKCQELTRITLDEIYKFLRNTRKKKLYFSASKNCLKKYLMLKDVFKIIHYFFMVPFVIKFYRGRLRVRPCFWIVFLILICAITIRKEERLMWGGCSYVFVLFVFILICTITFREKVVWGEDKDWGVFA